MKNKITKLFKGLSYEWELVGNRLVFEGEVWIGEINEILDKEGFKYKWCYENSKATYYISKE